MKTLLKKALFIFMATVAINANAQQNPNIKKVTYVCNFDCPSCEAKIMKNIPYEKGIKDVKINYEQKLVTVEYKKAKNTDAGIKQALEKLGYEVSVQTEPVYFNVKGNCGMCKTKIENAAKSVYGVTGANWNVNTKVISVYFNESETTLKAINNAIAKVGYDTDTAKAEDSVYNGLHECCKYER